MYLIILTLLIQCFGCQPQTDIAHILYKGSWSSQQLLPTFSSHFGALEMVFKFKAQYSVSATLGKLDILLMDPTYHDQNTAKITIFLSDYKTDQAVWSDKSTASIELMTAMETTESKQCEIQYTIAVQNASEIDGLNMRYSLDIRGTSQDPDCVFQYSARHIKYIDQSISLLSYMIFICLVIAVQLYSAYKVMTQQAQLNNISLLMLSIMFVQDTYLCLLHFYIMQQFSSLYLYIGLPIFGFGALVVADIKLIKKVFLAQYSNQAHRPFLFRRSLLLLTSLGVQLVSYFCLMYLTPYNLTALVFQSLIYIPQIYSNTATIRKGPFKTWLYLGCLGFRAMLPLYLRGCPQNILQLVPSLGFCSLWFSCFIFQIMFVFLQSRLGGRFFIARCCMFIFQQTSYRRVTLLTPMLSDCNICLQEQECRSKRQFIETPCGHLFHEECLKAWVEIKAECPMCRRRLPEFDELLGIIN